MKDRLHEMEPGDAPAKAPEPELVDEATEEQACLRGLTGLVNAAVMIAYGPRARFVLAVTERHSPCLFLQRVHTSTTLSRRESAALMRQLSDALARQHGLDLSGIPPLDVRSTRFNRID